MRIMSTRLALLAAAVAGVVLTASCAAANGSSTSDTNQRYVAGTGKVETVSPQDRKPAPVVSGEALDGRKLTTASYRGKVVVLNFWASWCPPCRAEAPALQRIWQQTRAEGVQFVGINFKDNRTNAKLFERQFKVTYPSIYDPPGETALAFRGQLPPAAVPSTIVIDRRGRIAARIIGQTNYTTLLPVVRQVAGE
jgi:thiol-disulfide isomerase/thioredoxin